VNWDAVGAIGEIAGALAVVITLVFLSRQMRETARQLSLASATEANTLFNEAFAPIYNNDHNMKIWVQGLREPASLCEDDLEIFFLFMARLVAVFDTVVAHHEQLGSLDGERLEISRRFIAQFLESPGGRVWTEQGRLSVSAAAAAALRMP
jgi:hypothetical protein